MMEPLFKKCMIILEWDYINPDNLPHKTLSRLHPDGNIVCCKCGVKATHVASWRHKNQGENQKHIDYFCQMPDGSMRMMTKDHILPKSMGGSNALTNLRAMCITCNNNRSNYVGNREMISFCADLRSHTSFAHMKKIGIKPNRQHPLAGWHAIFERCPELENAVRFQ